MGQTLDGFYIIYYSLRKIIIEGYANPYGLSQRISGCAKKAPSKLWTEPWTDWTDLEEEHLYL